MSQVYGQGVHMDTVVWRVGQALSVGSMALMLAACGGSSMPTAADPAAAAKTTTVAEAAPTASMLVSGVVVDSSGHPVAGADIECMGTNLSCADPKLEVIAQDGPDQSVKTRADGTYQVRMVVSGSAAGPFLMSAHAAGYEVDWRQVSFPDPACGSDQPGCAVTANFTLTPQS
jgi:hypothetical protein